jgi:AbrB family looped-hinge helix DNA binding protein
MARPKKTACCGEPGGGTSTYHVESIVTIDERGQMVLPKPMRDKAGIRAGDRLALVSWTKDGRVCCISLIRAEELTSMVTGFLSSLSAATPTDPSRSL